MSPRMSVPNAWLSKPAFWAKASAVTEKSSPHWD